MANEAIEKIKETEKQALVIRETASAKAADMIRDERRRCDEEFEQTEKQLKADNKAMLEEMRKKAESLIERSRAEANAEAETLISNSSGRKSEAAELIIKRMANA